MSIYLKFDVGRLHKNLLQTLFFITPNSLCGTRNMFALDNNKSLLRNKIVFTIIHR